MADLCRSLKETNYYPWYFFFRSITFSCCLRPVDPLFKLIFLYLFLLFISTSSCDPNTECSVLKCWSKIDGSWSLYSDSFTFFCLADWPLWFNWSSLPSSMLFWSFWFDRNYVLLWSLCSCSLLRNLIFFWDLPFVWVFDWFSCGRMFLSMPVN